MLKQSTIHLMNKYKCEDLDIFVKTNQKKGKAIIKCYDTLSETLLEERLKQRDYALSLDFCIDELCNENGYYIGSELKREINKREQEVRKFEEMMLK